jgi:hypothetical protein
MRRCVDYMRKVVYAYKEEKLIEKRVLGEISLAIRVNYHSVGRRITQPSALQQDFTRCLYCSASEVACG